jgi:hypothetical protein
MSENALKALDVMRLTDCFSEIIAQFDGAVPVHFDHFDNQ